MKTPICDFVNEYAESEKVRLHMPGHKGKDFLSCEKYDITEIGGADVLYSANGIIKDSMENASFLFGSEKTLYSTEGSSLAIRAMVYLVKLYALYRGEKAKILACRNAHKTFITAAALIDVHVSWLYPENGEGIISCNISGERLENELALSEEKPTALYVTSPDYLGNIADIRSLSHICRKNGVLLIVDNAHGAYLNFLEENRHPLFLGADMCCDSAHKTLPVLTGGAYLHISKNAPKLLSEKAEYALSLFASTSPSYLILQSLDKANDYLSSDYKKELSYFVGAVQGVKKRLEKAGYVFIGDEPLKLTFDAKKYGYKGDELDAYLYEKSFICEFSDPDYTVLMLSASNSEKELMLLMRTLELLPKKEEITQKPPVLSVKDSVLPLSAVLYAKTEKVKSKDSIGRILGSVSVSCPPAIPIVISGERIGEKELALFEYYGIDECEVIVE